MGASAWQGATVGAPAEVSLRASGRMDIRASLNPSTDAAHGAPEAGSPLTERPARQMGCFPETPIRAVQAISSLRGGSQSKLILGEDQALWVVKFKNNPQHSRVLANEFLASRMAELVGLSVPRTGMIQVSEWLIECSPQLVIQYGYRRWERCASGLQFGSRFGAGVLHQQAFDLLPGEWLRNVCNLSEFAPMLAFDRWTSNTDRRQAIFLRNAPEPDYRVLFIDQGSCFSGSQWEFQDAPLLGRCMDTRVYAAVTGWNSFEPWLTRMEEFDPELLWGLAQAVPSEWHGADQNRLELLVETLLARRHRLREMIWQLRRSRQSPFPNWRGGRLLNVQEQISDAAEPSLAVRDTAPGCLAEDMGKVC